MVSARIVTLLLLVAACGYRPREIPPEVTTDEDVTGSDAGADTDVPTDEDGDTAPACTNEIAANGIDDDCDGFTDECESCGCPNITACFPFDADLLNHAGTSFAMADTINVALVNDGKLDGAARFTTDSKFGTNDAAQYYAFTPEPQRSIEMWIRPDLVPDTTRQGLFDQDGKYSMYLEVGGVLQCRRSGVAESQAGAITAGVWQHVVCAFGATEMRGYVDGERVAKTDTTVYPTGDHPTHIGSNANGVTYDEPFIGDLDNVRIWDTALTDDQVDSFAN